MTTFWSAIANGAILSALLSLVVWLALQITPRRALNAATRYAIWWLVLLATLALPLAYVRFTPAHRTTQAVLTNATRDLPRAPSITTASATRRAIALPLEIPASKWLQPLLIFWIVTSLLLVARVILSYAALYRRSARAADAPPELRARLRASRPRTRIALSEEIAIPMAVGPFRPAILIPAGLFSAMTETDLDQIGLHEATHLARRDDCTLFLQRIVEALFALHPVVRWITRQLDLEREVACDDAVARCSESARSYADCLTRMVQACGGVRPSLAAAAFADSRSHLSKRVELLVRANRTDSPRLRPQPVALIAVALIGAAALLAKTPLLLAFSAARAPILFDPPMLTKPAPPQVLAQATPSAPTPKQQEESAQGEVYLQLGKTYGSKGDYPAAINALEQAAALLPNDAAVFTNLGLLYDAQGNLPQARRNYERALAIDPSNAIVLNNLAYLLAETGGDLDLALTYARTAQQKLPNFHEVNDTIGWIYLKKGLISDAAGAFKILTDAMPANPEYHYHYALALFQQGDRQEAFIQCKTAEEKNPKPELEKQIRALMDKLAPVIDTKPEPGVSPRLK